MTDCIRYNRKPLFRSVLEINSISSSSLELELIIKALRARDLIRLIFLFTRIERVPQNIQTKKSGFYEYRPMETGRSPTN